MLVSLHGRRQEVFTPPANSSDREEEISATESDLTLPTIKHQPGETLGGYGGGAMWSSFTIESERGPGHGHRRQTRPMEGPCRPLPGRVTAGEPRFLVIKRGVQPAVVTRSTRRFGRLRVATDRRYSPKSDFKHPYRRNARRLIRRAERHFVGNEVTKHSMA